MKTLPKLILGYFLLIGTALAQGGHVGGGAGGENQFRFIQGEMTTWLHRHRSDGLLNEIITTKQLNDKPVVKEWLKKTRQPRALDAEMLLQAYDQAIATVGDRIKFFQENELLSAASNGDPLAQQLIERPSRTCVNWVNPVPNSVTQQNEGYIYCVTERYDEPNKTDAGRLQNQGFLASHEVFGIAGLEDDSVDVAAPAGMDPNFSRAPISDQLMNYAGYRDVKEFAMFDLPFDRIKKKARAYTCKFEVSKEQEELGTLEVSIPDHTTGIEGLEAASIILSTRKGWNGKLHLTRLVLRGTFLNQQPKADNIVSGTISLEGDQTYWELASFSGGGGSGHSSNFTIDRQNYGYHVAGGCEYP